MTMQYQFLHYSDIKEATVTVTAVQGNLVTLRTQSTYYDGSTKQENITINIGSGDKTTIVPTNQSAGWISTHGDNTVKAVDNNNHLEITLKPKNGYAEVNYTPQNPLDLSDITYFYYYISINSNITQNEHYTIWMTDTNGKSKYFPAQSNTDEPKNPNYTVWDKKEWFNFDTITNEELDRTHIENISLTYEGNTTQTVQLKNFESDQPLTHGHKYFKYLVTSPSLVKGDPIYPDVPYVINEEQPNDEHPEPIIMQHTYRNLNVAFADCDNNSCNSAYTYDKDTGILVKYWTAKSGIQIQLIDQKNAWSPPNSAVYAAALIHEGWINYTQPNAWYILGAVSLYIGGFVGVTVYDRWKRGVLNLGMMKQWWPFLLILLVMFVLGEVIRRLGV